MYLEINMNMKKLNLLSIVIFTILSFYAQKTVAQNISDSVRISDYLHITHSDHSDWIKRYQKDINKYIDENKKMKDFSCDALFIGSSSINLWKNIYNDMAPLKIIRRSYGGSTIRDMIYNYEVIARGYKPKSIVMYVENDFCSCKEGISVGETYDLFRVFIRKVQTEYPDTPFFIVSFKPSFAKGDQLPQQLVINSLLQDYCNKTPNLYYLDITKGMYDAEGNLRKDIFVSDNLHMNQNGYDIWTPIIKNAVLDKIK